jgi:hypothetical protein
MFGGELRNNDEWTLSLITNEEVLNINQHSHGAHPVSEYKGIKIWCAESEKGEPVIAVFNTAEKMQKISLDFAPLGISDSYTVRDLWQKEDIFFEAKSICTNINPHGAVLYLLKK